MGSGSEGSRGPLISVALCTYFRPQLLGECLESLVTQNTQYPFEIIVVDNDAGGSAYEAVKPFIGRASEKGLVLRYVIEPRQNLALARNHGIAEAKGDWIAFIDDDETAEPNWLENLMEAAKRWDADGVWGPVARKFPAEFPQWFVDADLMPTARKDENGLYKGNLATGNALVRKVVLLEREGPFSEFYGITGGSDTELFGWLGGKGWRFFATSDAVVTEFQPVVRSTVRWNFRRSYRGSFRETREDIFQLGRITAWCKHMWLAGRDFLLFSQKLLVNWRRPRVGLILASRHLGWCAGRVGAFVGVRVVEYKAQTKQA